MKKTISAIMSLLILCSALVLPASAHENPVLYDDVNSDAWYFSTIYEARELGLFAGTSETEFSPKDTMTRGMFLTVLGKMAKIDLNAYKTSRFEDVPKDAYYAPYINWASEKELVSGTGKNRFSPEDPVTREQACIMLYRYAMAYDIKLGDFVNSDPLFEDTNPLAEISKTAIHELYAAGVVLGRSAYEFAPTAGLIRAEAAQLFVTVYHTYNNVTNYFPSTSSDWEFFHVTVPADLYGTVALIHEAWCYGPVGGIYSSIHFHEKNSMERMFSITAVQNREQDLGIFLDDNGNLQERYHILNTVLNTVLGIEREWLVLFDDNYSMYSPPTSYAAEHGWYQIKGHVEEILDSLVYDDFVKVIR